MTKDYLDVIRESLITGLQESDGEFFGLVRGPTRIMVDKGFRRCYNGGYSWNKYCGGPRRYLKIYCCYIIHHVNARVQRSGPIIESTAGSSK